MIIKMGFSTPKRQNPLSYLIKLIEGTPFSHAYIALRVEPGINVIYEANTLGLHFKSYRHFKIDNTIIKEYPLQIDNEQYNDLLSFLFNDSGKPYSVYQLIGILVYRIGKVFGKTWKITRDGTTQQVCSEVIAGILHVIDPSFVVDFDYATPKDLYQYLEKRDKET